MDKKQLIGDLFGGLSAMLVALPSAIAFSLIIYFPLGPSFIGQAAFAGLMGSCVLGFLAPLLGNTKHMISGPCAPAAAILSVFAMQLVQEKSIPPQEIPLYIGFVSFLAGTLQFLIGCLKGGQVIKYIPYPVVTGYLSGVGILIFLEQVANLLGLEKGPQLFSRLLIFSSWQAPSVVVGSATILGMILLPKLTKIPPVIGSLGIGTIVYFCLSLIWPELLDLENNPFIIGPIPSVTFHNLFPSFFSLWSTASFSLFLVPFLTLAALISIDTLKTCVILDAKLGSRHNSNRELQAQGIGNLFSSLLGGSPGAGTVAPSLVNIANGSQTRLSSLFYGASCLAVMLFLSNFIAFLPLASLAGVLVVVASKMVDIKSIRLIKRKSTLFDFCVILAVVISGLSLNLMIGAVVGTLMAITLFLREQIRSSVVRRKLFGYERYSKKRRPPKEAAILEASGKKTLICELQGSLFFGTADKLFLELEPHLLSTSYIILDMKRVRSIDFTALNLLKQIEQRLLSHGGHLIMTSLSPSFFSTQNLKEYLYDFGFVDMQIYQDLNSALEAVEESEINNILKEKKDPSISLQLQDFEFFQDFPKEALQKISEASQKVTLESNQKIFSIQDKSHEIYFLSKGTVKINLPLAENKKITLLTLSQGDLFGELSFLDAAARSAEAIAQEEVILYVLTKEDFGKICENHPEISSLFFKKLAQTVSLRLRLTNIELLALEES